MRAVALRWCSSLANRLLVRRPTIWQRPCVHSAIASKELAEWRPRCSRTLATAAQAKAEPQTCAEPPLLQYLPWSCPGCGAYTQQDDPEGAGFYSLTRKPVRAFVAAKHGRKTLQKPMTIPEEAITSEEAAINKQITSHEDVATPAEVASHEAVIKSEEATPREEAPPHEPEDTEVGQESQNTSRPSTSGPPICDRCHSLLHHNQGAPITHPPLSAVQAIFDETPYGYNHIYHVIDAADFPLSVIPKLHEWLDISQRTQNRRAKHAKFYRGRVAEMSFIITRSDLLAPKKEQVDMLMPVMVRILRRALGRTGRHLRLGNVRMVSSHRGWWTKDVKQSIWQRGGGGWMVGKVNVGKSNLFQNLLPKGRIHSRDLLKIQSANKAIEATPAGMEQITRGGEQIITPGILEEYGDTSLLPPRPKEVDFPVLPIVSGLPGTTASPIRVPFGKGKGELIDLPGLSRGGLEDHILAEHRSDLLMTSRVKAKQVVIGPWQSLVISNFIRITPRYPEVPFLAFPFLPHNVEYHVCHTDKAKEILAQTRNHVLKGIATPETAETIRSAGTYQLTWDITGRRAGPLTAKDAVGLSPERLPFAVYGLDVLIESIGWVEITAQVRRKSLEEAPVDPETGESLGIPEIEVFSPNGQHVGHRETLNSWLLGGQRKLSKSQRRAPPRKSMKGVKKAMKLAKREERARQRAAPAPLVE